MDGIVSVVVGGGVVVVVASKSGLTLLLPLLLPLPEAAGTLMTYMLLLPSLSLAKAIFVPSGDQTGEKDEDSKIVIEDMEAMGRDYMERLSTGIENAQHRIIFGVEKKQIDRALFLSSLLYKIAH